MTLAVIDTNAIVSNLLSPAGVPGQMMSRWKAGLFEIALSEAILEEIREVLIRPKIVRLSKLSADELEEFLQLLQTSAVFVKEPLMILRVVREDPDDDVILATALAANADVIVTGDSHLLALERYEGIPIVTPRIFLAMLH